MAEARFDPAVLRAEADNPLLDRRAFFPTKHGGALTTGPFVVAQVVIPVMIAFLIWWMPVQEPSLIFTAWVLLNALWWIASYLGYVEAPPLRAFLSLRHPRARSFFEAGITARDVVQAKCTRYHERDFRNRWLLAVVTILPTVTMALLFAGIFLVQEEGISVESFIPCTIVLFITGSLGVWMRWSLPRYRTLWLLNEPNAVLLSFEIRAAGGALPVKVSELHLESLSGLGSLYPVLDAMAYLLFSVVGVVVVLLPLALPGALALIFGKVGTGVGAVAMLVSWAGFIWAFRILLEDLDWKSRAAWRRICLEDDRRWQEIVSTLEERGIAKRA